MKASQCLILFLPLFLVVRAETSSSVAKTVPPKCGFQCIIELASKSPCGLTNTTCICTNPDLADTIGLCVRANCTIREQITTEKYSKEACGAPSEDRRQLITILGLTGGAVALLAVSLRILSKLLGASGYPGMDDLCIGAAMLLCFPFTVFAPIVANKGLGLDIWEVPFDNITYILYVYFWDELIYVTVLPLTKISILFFYLRVFSNQTFRKVVYLVMAVNVAFCLVYIIISVFQCTPIEGAWTRWDGTFQGNCRNINMQGWMNAVINILLDLATLLLPLPMLSRLGLSRRKKIQIFSMFSVGFFVTVVSILRLRTLLQFANTSNVTQDYVTLGYWSTIEVHVGIICACMPAIRQLLRSTFPAAFGSTNIDSMPTSAAFGNSQKGSSKILSLTSNASARPVGRDDRSSLQDHSSAHSTLPLADLENRPGFGIGYYGIAH